VHLYSLEAFQTPLERERPSHFLKTIGEPISLFKNCEKIPVYGIPVFISQ